MEKTEQRGREAGSGLESQAGAGSCQSLRAWEGAQIFGVSALKGL